ncbi:hypothetical protein B0H16DRAFT_1889846 [Mycena metata]|uniref:MYND-type domain-containing protein n=1 Tax=Mycena metata TaxID=1033252 RepID=A0AAD7IIJ0_9AGAR|nr:hypothetical protein B0H16DRAFT_1889846 [Mycena metata]
MAEPTPLPYPMDFSSLLKSSLALKNLLHFLSLHRGWKVGIRAAHHAILEQLFTFILAFDSDEVKKCEAGWSVCHLERQKTQGNPDFADIHEMLHFRGTGARSLCTFNDVVIATCNFAQWIVHDLNVKVDREVDLWPNPPALLPGGPLRLLVALLDHLPRDNTLLAALIDSPDFISAVASDFTKRRKVEDKVLVYGSFCMGMALGTLFRYYNRAKPQDFLRPQAQLIYDGMRVLRDIYGNCEGQSDVHAKFLVCTYVTPMAFITNLLPPEYEDDHDINAFLNPCRFFHKALSLILHENEESPICGKALCSTRGERSPTKSLCSAYRLLKFCSPACHKQTWVWKPAPHKAICNELARALAIKALATNEVEWSAGLRAGGFTDERMRDIIVVLRGPEEASIDYCLRTFGLHSALAATLCPPTKHTGTLGSAGHFSEEPQQLSFDILPFHRISCSQSFL